MRLLFVIAVLAAAGFLYRQELQAWWQERQAAPVTAAKVYYKWRDKKGRINYSSSKPTDVADFEVIAKPAVSTNVIKLNAN